MGKIKIKVFGRVQGVFFRQSAQEKAKELGVSCETENMPDGTVEIIVSPETQKISQFIEWCKVGPEYAEVERVEVTEMGD